VTIKSRLSIFCVFLIASKLTYWSQLICDGLISRMDNHAPGGLYIQVDTNVTGGSDESFGPYYF
jgi:hypothetical protein